MIHVVANREAEKEWILPVSWEVFSQIKVQAETLEEALEWAEDHIDEIPLGDDPDYVDGSYQINVDSVEEAAVYNSCAPSKRGKEELRFPGTCEADSNITVNVWPDEETPVSIEGPVVRADWVDIGEGYCGDYDPDDSDDEQLLRFDVYIKDEEGWENVDDASYCTLIAKDTDIGILIDKLYSIYKEYDNILSADPEQSVKKLGENLSWIDVTEEDLEVLEHSRKRCQGCAHLVEGIGGTWVCSNWESDVRHVPDDRCAKEADRSWQ